MQLILCAHCLVVIEASTLPGLKQPFSDGCHSYGRNSCG